MNGTKQCLKNCNDGIFNPLEDICYKTGTPCSYVASNTKLITTLTGQQKCDCAYKFYYESNGKKHCLPKKGVCPQDFSKLIPDTLQCVSACPTNDYSFEFKNLCLNQCPLGSEISGTTCSCGNKFWYQAATGNYECVDNDCPHDFPFYNPGTKQCFKSCKKSFYYINLYENKCYGDCTDVTDNMVPVSSNSDYADYQCECISPWYFYIDNNDNKKKVHCPADSELISRCEQYDTLSPLLPFMVKETRECVETCPSNYPYYFNHICYTSCQNANDAYRLNIKEVSSSFECTCQNLWYIDTSNSYQDKICYDKDINECPPSNSNTPRYLIDATKQCVDAVNDCPANSFIFNFICYTQCPQFTIDDPDTSGNTCKCDTTNYLYLQYEKYGQTYYKCGLESCPDKFIVNNQEIMRKNLLKSENKCVKSCRDDGSTNNEYKKSFRNTCVKVCPELTIDDDDDPTAEDN